MMTKRERERETVGNKTIYHVDKDDLERKQANALSVEVKMLDKRKYVDDAGEAGEV
jgi:hypothetical protein